MWHHNTYPGAARHPRTCTSSRSRLNPRWSAGTRQQSEIQAYTRGRWRGHSTCAAAPTCAPRAPTAGGRSRRAPVSAPRTLRDRRRGQLTTPAIPPSRGSERLRRPDVPHRPLGSRRRPHRQARRGDRHRLQRDPGRARDPADRRPRAPCSSAPPAGRSRRATSLPAVGAAAVRAPARPAAGPGRQLRLPRLRRLRAVTAQDRAAATVPSSSASCRSGTRSRTPSCGAKVTPKDEIGCKRIMLTDDWHPTLAKPNVDLTDQRIEHIGPNAIRTADGVEHPRTCSCSPPASARTTSWSRWRSAPDRTHAQGEWARRPARLPRHHRAGLPEPVPALRAEHERRPRARWWRRSRRS